SRVSSMMASKARPISSAGSSTAKTRKRACKLSSRSASLGSAAANRVPPAMKIAVCVKVVPEAQKRLNPGTKRLERSGELALNPFDVNAVEEALRVKEASAEGEVVVVSMGPERALDPLRKALAMGADRAV